ncbi:hypothetical protein A2291_07930 [candidate division WOR-1 bacterium RIFOXYB2_FULL_42_35]|uniref:Com family DNA-binding transcriptional regulator n=1 Tax=candidate division WOR-1 bacterium RIFOXYC2_FULL_41_25 TaxID=1802586 RepID=A0A1F4TJQ9_UNCSA|nr:MAG: hypothetical protein A2247_08455 [candidate division WOR-1 bacterium RIFOXYA2_FULL_41_14]OGC21896.1 MAG: hypothetical protein A2291_07930 [candidate division WOR-1 bacterium RIFOXYB2_FULL_42_35]OGC32760.1 MAG: hypothetical protein A2462_03905 [candidate division WOR-1 bacterium RIFOXYC2_FULL_41_25]OGC42556.1 MAG: hypothetical protein A2548_01160 [candidate division WOR-1 bacterium RIFOXYD2_FULL_41_8]
MKDFRCSKCNRLLAKIDGDALVEIKCPRCKEMNSFTEEVYITIEDGAQDKCTDLDPAGA